MSRISEPGARARMQGMLADALPGLLPPFLGRQRWFGAKGRPLRSAALEDLAWLPCTEPAALAVVGVEYEDAPPDRYLLLLRWAREPREGATVGRVGGLEGTPWLVEGSADATVAAALLRGLCVPASLATMGGGAIVFADVDASGGGALAAETLDRGAVKPLAAEQSNTTWRVGSTHVFKLFRRLEAGENPEAEVTRFLTTTASFRGCPALRGTIGYRCAGSPDGTIGVLEDWVENQGDGWTHALRLLARGDAGDGIPSLLRDLTVLGRTTAEFHAALASSRRDPDFAPEPFSAADRNACAVALRGRASRVLARLRGARGGLAPQARDAVDRLLAADSALASWDPPDLERPGAAFEAIRIHGDFHLGQTLKTREGYIVIDFEGEPAVPRAERRRKQPAMRDVAGMLRSFDYAVVASKAGGDREDVVGRMRSAYLDGYRRSVAARNPSIAPEAPAARDAWIEFFELSKALYEIDYELDNRPDWLGIPLGGIVRLLERPTTNGVRA